MNTKCSSKLIFPFPQLPAICVKGTVVGRRAPPPLCTESNGMGNCHNGGWSAFSVIRSFCVSKNTAGRREGKLISPHPARLPDCIPVLQDV